VEAFTENVIKIIQQIPAGNVMTYGQIAKLAGSPRGARQVVRILHSMSLKYELPWHRVINIKGEIGIQDDEGAFTQKALLESEGVRFKGNKVLKIEKYRYEPKFEWMELEKEL
jgi:methylated-DNA-protein-cysteine methyltransferase related protein